MHTRFYRFRCIVPSLALIVGPALARAQAATDTVRIAPIVVTATRSPLSSDRSPASATVISGERLRREGVTSVADALRSVPGLTVVPTGSYGGVTSLFIRGGESKFTKVLIDGIPVNDAGGAFDFSSLTTDNIDRIEIVRGPASVLYGSDAMAGVVQLFTQGGNGPTRVDVSARGGTFGSYDADAAIRGGTPGLSYSLAGAQHTTDGIHAFNSQFRQRVASARLRALGARSDAALSLRHTDNNVHFPTNGSGQVVDSNAMHREDRIAVGLDAGYRVHPTTEVRVALASHDGHGVSLDEPDSPGDKDGYYFSTADRTRRRSGDVRVNVDARPDLHLSVGVMAERQWQESQTESNFGPSAFTARRRTTGSYAQMLFAPLAPFTVTLGLRHERNERFGDFLTYRAAASARVAADTRIRASVGTAFREPTFLENYGGAFAIGNPKLAPEHAISADAGVEQGLGEWVTIGATWFANSFRNLIDYRYSATEPNYFNLARTRSSGVEVEARAASPVGLSTDASFTYLATRVVDPGTSSAVTAIFAPGARLLRRPMHTLQAGVSYQHSIGSVDVRANRVGPREDNYFAPDFTAHHVTLPGYTRVDASAQWAVIARQHRSVRLTLRAENLFDATYTDVAGFNHDFARTDPVTIAQTGYRGAGRRILSGVRLTY